MLRDAQHQVGIASEKFLVFLLRGAEMQKILVLDVIEQRRFRQDFAEDEELGKFFAEPPPGWPVDEQQLARREGLNARTGGPVAVKPFHVHNELIGANKAGRRFLVWLPPDQVLPAHPGANEAKLVRQLTGREEVLARPQVLRREMPREVLYLIRAQDPAEAEGLA